MFNEDWTQNYDPVYTNLHVTSFCVNYKKPHRSRLKYEVEYDPYKIAQIKNLKFELLRFLKT